MVIVISSRREMSAHQERLLSHRSWSGTTNANNMFHREVRLYLFTNYDVFRHHRVVRLVKTASLRRLRVSEDKFFLAFYGGTSRI